MTFQPVVPFGGYSGWLFLERTLERQLEIHSGSPGRKRDTDYFREKISSVATPEDLVSDRRLLGVALGAFGLDDDINNKFFLQQILSDGTTDRDALANRLADKRYLDFATAFGFGDGLPPRTGLTGFADEILSQYQVRQFEIDVGSQNEAMRLALTAKRELEQLASADGTDDSRWFRVMGNPPLRNVFETAFGLPSSFGTIDLEDQLEVFRDRSSSQLSGPEISQFSDAEAREDLVRLFLVRSEIQASSAQVSRGQIALQLLAGA